MPRLMEALDQSGYSHVTTSPTAPPMPGDQLASQQAVTSAHQVQAAVTIQQGHQQQQQQASTVVHHQPVGVATSTQVVTVAGNVPLVRGANPAVVSHAGVHYTGQQMKLHAQGKDGAPVQGVVYHRLNSDGAVAQISRTRPQVVSKVVSRTSVDSSFESPGAVSPQNCAPIVRAVQPAGHQGEHVAQVLPSATSLAVHNNPATSVLSPAQHTSASLRNMLSTQLPGQVEVRHVNPKALTMTAAVTEGSKSPHEVATQVIQQVAAQSQGDKKNMYLVLPGSLRDKIGMAGSQAIQINNISIQSSTATLNNVVQSPRSPAVPVQRMVLKPQTLPGSGAVVFQQQTQGQVTTSNKMATISSSQLAQCVTKVIPGNGEVVIQPQTTGQGMISGNTVASQLANCVSQEEAVNTLVQQIKNKTGGNKLVLTSQQHMHLASLVPQVQRQPCVAKTTVQCSSPAQNKTVQAKAGRGGRAAPNILSHTKSPPAKPKAAAQGRTTISKIVPVDDFHKAVEENRPIFGDSVPFVNNDECEDNKKYMLLYQNGTAVEVIRKGDHFVKVDTPPVKPFFSCMVRVIHQGTAPNTPGGHTQGGVFGGGRGSMSPRGKGRGRGRGGRGRGRPDGSAVERSPDNPAPVGSSTSVAGQSSESPGMLKSRPWSHSKFAIQELKRRPIHEEAPASGPDCPPDLGQSSSQDGNTSVDNDTDRKAQRDVVDGVLALCPNCGCESQNYDICESCDKPLPEEAKKIDRRPEGGATAGLTVNKKKFYGANSKEKHDFYASKLNEQSQVYRGRPKRKVSTHTKNSRGRGGRRQMPLEPETVILSSDDEDQEMKEKKKTKMDTPEPSSSEDKEAPQDSLMLPPQETLAKTKKDGKVPGVKEPPKVDEEPEEGSVVLPLRQVHIGSLALRAIGQLVVNTKSITFSVSYASFNMKEQIHGEEMVRVLACLRGDTPSIIIHSSLSCGERMRKAFKMSEESGPYFNPSTKEEQHKRIVFVLEPHVSPEAEHPLTHIFTSISKMYKGTVPHPFLFVIDENELHRLLLLAGVLVQHAPPPQLPTNAAQAISAYAAAAAAVRAQYHDEDEDDEDKSRSPSPLPRTFKGEIIKLFTYPPGKGGIAVTTEDFFCLNEGEFLNDVIIDFYLKYIYLNKLSEEDRQKTHIFSSFFYRRLTQKPPRNMQNPEESKLPLPERRHNRVKTWTRHVDLFAKDYIIVPINESSHWYLAIICFPALERPVQVQYRISRVNPASPPPAADSNGTAQQDETSQPADPNCKRELPLQGGGQTGPGTGMQEAPGSAHSSQESTEEPMDTREDGQNSISQDSSSTRPSSPAGSSTGQSTAESQPETELVNGVKQACILIFDSLAGPQRNSVIRTLREYLSMEWKIKKEKTCGPRVFDKDTVKGGSPICPQQTNFSDCGVFVLQYVESFFENPVVDYTMPVHLMAWFLEETVLRKREELRMLIWQLKQKMNPDLKVPDMQDMPAIKEEAC